MNQNITTAILITCHNRKNKTLKCLKHLSEQNINLDIYLVDDGCTDGTSDAVKKEFPYVIIIQGNGDLFWNRGMIKAWETASTTYDYDYYIWMNDDTYIYQDSVKLLLKSSKVKNDQAIIVGASCDPQTPNKTTFGADFKHKAVYPNGELQEIDSFGGNFVLVPKFVFHKIGMLDHFYRHSLGDIDYARRAKENNIKMYLAPKHTGTCIYDTVFPKWKNKEFPLIQRFKLLYTPLSYSNPNEFFYFYKKHEGLLSAILHYISIHLKLLI